jgi:hypothetical protein
VTPLGRSLHPIFKSVCDWAGENFPDVEKARATRSTAGAWGRRDAAGLKLLPVLYFPSRFERCLGGKANRISPALSLSTGFGFA